jgi:Protein kinase domain.
MTPQQYQRILELYEQTVGKNKSDQERFLETACPDDATVLARLRDMLEVADNSPEHADFPAIGQSIRLVAAEVSRNAAAGNSSTAPLAGARLGKYELIDLIGEGGMGAVYRARQDHPRRIVAIKIIRTALASPGTDAQIRARSRNAR